MLNALPVTVLPLPAVFTTAAAATTPPSAEYDYCLADPALAPKLLSVRRWAGNNWPDGGETVEVYADERPLIRVLGLEDYPIPHDGTDGEIMARTEALVRRLVAAYNRTRNLDIEALEEPTNHVLFVIGESGAKALVDVDELAQLREKVAYLDADLPKQRLLTSLVTAHSMASRTLHEVGRLDRDEMHRRFQEIADVLEGGKP